MFTRFVGVSRGARAYSSAQKADSALFLSDLMKRIDSINLRTKRIVENKVTNSKSEQVSKQEKTASSKKGNATKKASAAKKSSAPKKIASQPARTGSVFRNQGRKISVRDHPLSRNTFKLMDESNFKRSDRSTANRANPPSRNADTKPARASAQRPRAPRPARRAPVKSANARPASGRIVSKDLVITDYKPAISGDDFFHGKPASLAISTSSRVAAVAKETLLESKYPYKLPKSIIDKLDSSFVGNKFILQKDYSLDVDVAKFGDRINKVVKGQVDTIDLGKNPEATSIFTATQLARNGDLSIAQQQTIYNVASGLKSAKLLVEGAVWNK